MRDTIPGQVTVSLERPRWAYVLDGLDEAAMTADRPGHCYCPEAGGDDICAGCAASMERAHTYRGLAERIRNKVGAVEGDGWGSLTLPASDWVTAVRGLREAAGILMDTGVSAASEEWADRVRVAMEIRAVARAVRRCVRAARRDPF